MYHEVEYGTHQLGFDRERRRELRYCSLWNTKPHHFKRQREIWNRKKKAKKKKENKKLKLVSLSLSPSLTVGAAFDTVMGTCSNPKEWSSRLPPTIESEWERAKNRKTWCFSEVRVLQDNKKKNEKLKQVESSAVKSNVVRSQSYGKRKVSF